MKITWHFQGTDKIVVWHRGSREGRQRYRINSEK